MPSSTRRCRPYRLPLAWGLALAVAGCALSPAKPLDPARTASRLERRTLQCAEVDSALQRAGIAPPATAASGWTPDALVVAAWRLRPDLAEARALAAAARDDAMALQYRASPTVSLAAEFVRHAWAENPWTLALTANWLPSQRARRAAQIERADAGARAALLQGAAAAWRVAAEVRSARLHLARVEEAAGIADEEVALRVLLERRSRRRVEVGADTRPAAAAAALSLLEARAAQAATASQHRQALRALEHALGLPPSGLRGTRLAPLRGVPQLGLAEASIRASAALHRIDLAQALADYDGAEAAEREQLSGRSWVGALAPGLAFDRGEHKWVLGADLANPSDARRNALDDAATRRRMAAAAHVLAVQSAAVAEVGQLLLEWRRAEAAWADADSERSLRAEVEAAARARWRAGMQPRAVWVEARLGQLAAMRARLARIEELDAIVGALESALQRPLWPASQMPAAAAATEEPEDASFD